MVKGIPLIARRANARTPYRGRGKGHSKPTTWKQKQRVFTMAGLRALGAPWARVPNPQL